MDMTEEQRLARVLGDAAVDASNAYAGAIALRDSAYRQLRIADNLRVRPWHPNLILPARRGRGCIGGRQPRLLRSQRSLGRRCTRRESAGCCRRLVVARCCALGGFGFDTY